MIYEADTDRDGEVSIEEFLRIMKKAKLYWNYKVNSIKLQSYLS